MGFLSVPCGLRMIRDLCSFSTSKRVSHNFIMTHPLDMMAYLCFSALMGKMALIVMLIFPIISCISVKKAS